ncbi:unnamed protein product [Blepharisma stoltei]|uniref:Phytoene synthase n=1 Tax=Blepharisma stoltei TaxID=1481888 RepID=A0AAU9IXU2_9CILI|nr:unnamed protein product [Blepharisma stoltei]
MKGINCFYSIGKQISGNNLTGLKVAETLYSLSKCKDSDSFFYKDEEWFKSLFSYTKSAIRRIDANHLAAITYYSALIKYFEADLWYVLEMQIARTDITSLMNPIGLIRTSQGFALVPESLPISHQEVFQHIEAQFVDRIDAYFKKTEKHALIPVEELGNLIETFASMNEGNKNFYSHVERLADELMMKNRWNLEDYSKILWGYVMMNANLSKRIRKVAEKIDESDLQNLPFQARNKLKWALGQINVKNK